MLGGPDLLTLELLPALLSRSKLLREHLVIDLRFASRVETRQ